MRLKPLLLALLMVHLIAPVSARAAADSGDPRVAVLPPIVRGNVAPHVKAKLAAKLQAGLQASEMNAISASPPEAEGCGPRCVRVTSQRAKTRYVAGARVVVRYSSYKMQLWIADGRTGKRLATVAETCAVCPPVAAASKLELAASRLVVALRERASKPAAFLVTSSPAGADVYIDGKLKGQSPLRLELPRGAYVLEVRQQGYYTGRKELKAIEAVEQKLNIVLVPKSKGGGKLGSVLGWSAIGVGVAAIVAGAVLLAIDGSDCFTTIGNRELCRKTTNTALPGWLLVGGGAALAGGGAAWLFWPRGGSKQRKRTLSNTRRITIAPTGLGLGLRGTF
ncbi:MAG: hypothetical protein CSB49_06060 [Proteobacteria bacterium]|nr:MAG: hypothetical protein CSB49_06060 [Pseudomonadota bacterium]